MTIQEINRISDDIADYLDWTLKAGLWDGRLISWFEASNFSEEVHARILQYFFSASDHFEAQLAWIGASPEARSLLDREIAALAFSKGDLLLPVGRKSHLSKFWKKHKKEVWIGLAVVVAITVVTVVAISTAGAGASAAAGAIGGEALREIEEKRKKAVPNHPPKQIEALPPSDPPLPKSALVFEETGIVIDEESISYKEILSNGGKPLSTAPTLEPSPPAVSPSPKFIAKFFDTVGKSMIEPELFDPTDAIPIPTRSYSFSTEGERKSGVYILGINGMNTTEEEARFHAEHLAKFTQGQPVDWVYNRSHGPVVDFLEIVALNLPGSSPNTADLLLEKWTTFHKDNADNPNKKLLHICHSQSTIHARNGLEKAPPRKSEIV